MNKEKSGLLDGKLISWNEACARNPGNSRRGILCREAVQIETKVRGVCGVHITWKCFWWQCI